MTKLGEDDVDEKDDVLYDGAAFVIRAMRLPNGKMPAKQWYDSLASRHQQRFSAACRAADTHLAVRGTSPRLGLYDEGFYALRVTNKGGSGPHFRLTLYREGATFWAGLAFSKGKRDLNTSEKEQALNLIDKWKSARPDDQQ